MRTNLAILFAALVLPLGGQAHHSFAPYDIRTKIEFSGVVVWPARDGSPEGVLSAFTSDGVYTLIHEEVRQRSANEAADAAEAAGN